MTAPSSRDPTWFLHEQLRHPRGLSLGRTTATTAPGDTTMRCYPWTRLPR
jgi:hypothetical protein